VARVFFRPRQSTAQECAALVLRLGIVQLLLAGADVVLFVVFGLHQYGWLATGGIAVVVGLLGILSGLTLNKILAVLFAISLFVRFGGYLTLDVLEWIKGEHLWEYVLQIALLCFSVVYLVFGVLFVYKLFMGPFDSEPTYLQINTDSQVPAPPPQYYAPPPQYYPQPPQYYAQPVPDRQPPYSPEFQKEVHGV